MKHKKMIDKLRKKYSDNINKICNSENIIQYNE